MERLADLLEWAVRPNRRPAGRVSALPRNLPGLGRASLYRESKGGTLDRSILDRFVQGDQAAFEAVYRHFKGEVRRWVLRIVRDEEAADEVLVEAFWRTYRGRARFDPSRSFGAWMRIGPLNAEMGIA